MAQASQRPNVLFIAVDDLRPEMKCYGVQKMVTPNLDRLAGQGVRFDHAYCNIAVCGASRASLLKGMRPTPTRFKNAGTKAKKDAPNVPSLPMLLKRNGYHTASFGKIYHYQQDDPQAWSEPPWRESPDRFIAWWALPENRKGEKRPGGRMSRGPAYEAADKPESIYPDYVTGSETIKAMRRLAKQDKPFFLACGFYKPHLPFVAPKKYWDLYPEDKVTLPDNMYFPRDLSKVFGYNWRELRRYRDIPQKGPVSEETTRNLVRGYAACVSFTDAQIGRLLDELKRLGLAENTIVVLWGDHGWQVGEHGLWCKHTNFEVATRVPLLIAAPGVKSGRASRQLVEYVDIYPTMCELIGLPLPDHSTGQEYGAAAEGRRRFS
ncbi:MAG: sulfatase [Planctomycetia bacterium]